MVPPKAEMEHEMKLGYEPRSLRRFWASADQKGMDDQKLIFR